MYIKPNRKSNDYIGTFVTSDKADMEKLSELRKSVAYSNKTRPSLKRVVARGRKPIEKLGSRSFDWGGNIVGGIANAGELDVYIYDRR